MPQRDISDLIHRKTEQTRYFDQARIRQAAMNGNTTKSLTFKEYTYIVNGGILETDTNNNIVGVDTRPLIININYIDFTTGMLSYNIPYTTDIYIHVNNNLRTSFAPNNLNGEYNNNNLKINTLGGNIQLLDNISFNSLADKNIRINESKPFNTYCIQFIDYVTSQTNLEELNQLITSSPSVNYYDSYYVDNLNYYNNYATFYSQGMYDVNNYQIFYDSLPNKVINLQKAIIFQSNNYQVYSNIYNLFNQSLITFSNSIINYNSAINKGLIQSIETFINQAISYNSFNTSVNDMMLQYSNNINNINNYAIIMTDPQYNFIGNPPLSDVIVGLSSNLNGEFNNYRETYSNYYYNSMRLIESLQSSVDFTNYLVSIVGSMISYIQTIEVNISQTTNIIQTLQEEMIILNSS
jgi:hypothetical protein